MSDYDKCVSVQIPTDWAVLTMPNSFSMIILVAWSNIIYFNIFLRKRVLMDQWRRYTSETRVSQVKLPPVSVYTLCQWFPNTQQSRFLTACRRLEKLILPSILTQVFHRWWCETCRIIQQQFWVKECDSFMGSEHTLISPTYFQGSHGQDLHPGVDGFVARKCVVDFSPAKT